MGWDVCFLGCPVRTSGKMNGTGANAPWANGPPGLQIPRDMGFVCYKSSLKRLFLRKSNGSILSLLQFALMKLNSYLGSLDS